MPATARAHVPPAAMGWAMVKLTALETPALFPVAAGLESVTLAVPAAARSVAGTMALNAAAVAQVVSIRLLSTHEVGSARRSTGW